MNDNQINKSYSTDKPLTLRQNVIWNSVGTIIYLFLQWILTVVVVRISGYADAGILSLCMSIGNVFAPVATYSIRQYQASDLLHEFQSGTYISTRLLTCFGVLCFGIAFSLLSHYTTYQIICIIIYVIFRILESFVDVFHGISQREHRMDIIGRSFFIRGVSNFIVFLVILLLSRKLSLALTAMVTSTILSILFFDLPQTRRLESVIPEWNFRKTKHLLFICTPLMLAGLISNVLSFYPRYLLEKQFGDQLMGIYSSVATPAIIIQVSASFIFAPLVPIFAGYFQENKKTELSRLLIRIAIYVAIISFLAIAVSIFFGEKGLILLFGRDIIPFRYLLLPAVVSSILTSIVWLLLSVLTAIRLLREQLISNVVAVALCLVISPFLIRTYNMNGVSFAFIFTQGIQITLMTITYTRYLRRVRE